jgi:hypothetical protein
MRGFNGLSLTTEAFWRSFHELPAKDQERARSAHSQWRENPDQPGLRFKRVHARKPIYSVRVSLDVRAVGVVSGHDIIWFWIASHRKSG